MNKASNFCSSIIIFRKPSLSPSSLLNFSSSPSSSSLRPPHCLQDFSSCIAFLQSCANRKSLASGKMMHSFLITSGFLRSPLSITSLINMYSKCNRLKEAVLVFYDPCHDRNVFAYNAIISGFIANSNPAEGLDFYDQMRSVGVFPDKFTFPCVVRAHGELSLVSEVKKTHGLLLKFGLELDVFIGSALVNTYLKFGCADNAVNLFEEMPLKDVVLWNSMVHGFAQMGKFKEALEVFRRMVEGVSPSRHTVTGLLSIFAVIRDLINGKLVHGLAVKMGYDSGLAVSNALIDMYGKCKCIEESLKIFKMMDEMDIFSWNSIISVLQQCGEHDKTLKLFDKMIKLSFRPDLVTITSVLPACSHLAALRHGREIHRYMLINGLGKGDNDNDGDDVFVHNAVMDMYAKCGSMRNAHLIFDMMSHRDVGSWNIMIMGYGMHGYGEEALDMFSRMQEARIEPDEVTFVGVLSACSHSGYVKQGRRFFTQMKGEFGVEPTIEHYTCVIDMLGRAGHLEEAYKVALTMPIQGNPVVWTALLAACQLHGNADLAKSVAKQGIELKPEHCGNYVLISNIYGVIGRYDEVSEIRHTMKEQNVKKTPGCSWIELKNGVHVFVNGDRNHPKSDVIHAELKALTAWLCAYGYVPEVSSEPAITFCVDNR